MNSETDLTKAHSGNGKIARLPDEIRNQVNQMLLDAVPYSTIIERLGEYGQDLEERHLTNWKTNNGFARWCAQRDLCQELKTTQSEAVQLIKDKPAGDIQDAARAVASGQLYELLHLFNPANFAAALSTKPELYLRLVSTFARLSEAETLCASRRLQQMLAQIKIEEAKVTETGAGGANQMYTGEQLKKILRSIRVL